MKVRYYYNALLLEFLISWLQKLMPGSIKIIKHANQANTPYNPFTLSSWRHNSAARFTTSWCERVEECCRCKEAYCTKLLQKNKTDLNKPILLLKYRYCCKMWSHTVVLLASYLHQTAINKTSVTLAHETWWQQADFHSHDTRSPIIIAWNMTNPRSAASN